MISCIYKIYFTPNPTSFYIGSAKDFKERKRRHKYLLKKGTHPNPHLQYASNKYGFHNIFFVILENPLIPNLIEREQFYLDTLNPSMNILKKAGSCLGYKHTEEHKEYVRSLFKGKKMKPEHVEINRLSHIGISNGKGRKMPEHQKENLRLLKQREVINTVTKTIYPSIGIASELYCVKYQTLYGMLSGRFNNATNLSFA